MLEPSQQTRPAQPARPRSALRSGLSVLAAFAVLALVYTYPLVLAPSRANRLDSPDALLNAWIVAHGADRLFSDPLRLFDANIFFPEPEALALSENLATAALIAFPLSWISAEPILLYNFVLFAGFVLTGWATFLLAHHLTESRLAAGLAGILFAFSPFRFAHIPHLQLQLAFGIPLMLYFGRRILEGDTSRAPLLGLAATIPLTFGSSVYYAVYGASVLPILVLFEWDGRRAARVAGAAGVGALLTLPLALPYWRKMSSGLERGIDTAREFSASGMDYLSSFARLHEPLAKTSEPLFPGFVALGLAGLGLVRGSKDRPWSWLAIAVFGVTLSLGPSFGLFSALFDLLPPYRALRVPSRAGVLFLLAIAILAARGLTRVERLPARLLLVALAAAECFSGPLPFLMEPPADPPIYRHIRTLEGEGALLELPLPSPDRFQDNAIYVYRSAFHRRDLVNGYSGFVPETYRRIYEDLASEPLSGTLERLRKIGVRYVLVHEGRVGPRKEREVAEALRKGLLTRLASEPPDRLYEITPGE